jgi:hypothetical protein
MVFKSPTQPYCRASGKPIPKKTTTVYFGRVMQGQPHHGIYPTTKEEAQALVAPAKIVSVKWDRMRDRGWEQPGEPMCDYIRWVGTWDGESYVDEFFASQNEAVRFAYLLAHAGHCTAAYTRRGRK